jgi:hypothetical protein
VVSPSRYLARDRTRAELKTYLILFRRLALNVSMKPLTDNPTYKSWCRSTAPNLAQPILKNRIKKSALRPMVGFLFMQPIAQLTLANMRANGVRTLAAQSRVPSRRAANYLY